MLPVIINLIIFAAIAFGIFFMAKKHLSFNKRVLAGLVGGIALGAIFQAVYSTTPDVITNTANWIAVVGSGYVRLLKMIVTPLIFVSISCAIINQKAGKNVGKTAGVIIAVLLITAAVSASVGIVTSQAFHLSAENLQVGDTEKARSADLQSTLEDQQKQPVQQQIVNIIPTNPFYAMTGQGSSATLSVVVFAAFIGVAVVGIRKKKPESAEFFSKMLNATHDVVMRLVTLILRLTPYGILALMTNTVAQSNVSEILRLITFVIGSYTAIVIMFIIHGIILAGFGLNPLQYFKKSSSVFSFAFTSRTSAGTLPLTIKTLTDKLGVSEGIANLSATLGTTIGQNGCAGIYPAMLVVMIAPTVGVHITPMYFITVVIVITLSSIGIAGVGGGATFAAITVLSILNLPVGLAGLLIAVEPLIDMARTALNVSDSMVSGVVASKVLNEFDTTVYNAEQNDAVDTFQM